MFFFQDLKKYVFQKKEINYLYLIFFGIILATAIEALSLSIIIPVFNIIFFNKYPKNISFLDFTNFDYSSKLLILFLFLSIFFIKNIFLIVFNYFYINFFNKLSSRVSNKLFDLTLNQSYIFFLEPSSNNILQIAIEEVKKMGSFFLSLINLLIEIIFVLVICIFLISANYKIFFFCFLNFSLVIFIYFRIFRNRIKNWSYTNQKSTGKVQDIILDGLRGIKDLIIYKLRGNFINLFTASNSDWYQTKSNIDFLNTVQKYWLELIGVASITSAMLYFVFVGSDINNLIPVFGLYVFAMFRLITSFSRIVHYAQNAKFCYPSYEIILNKLKKFNLYNEVSKANHDFDFKNLIKINNASFAYDNKFKVLNNINLEISKGDCVAIIGKNGSGKSTLLNLISALIKPTEGNILIDSKFDLYLNKILWHTRLSYVQQNIFLLNDTIKNNIILNNGATINKSRFEKIADTLRLEDFFRELPKKLDTQVNNDGLNLSGGQKQMISFARALYKESEIIILDEPSSALDLINTKLLREVILSIKNERTIIMVTHDKDFFYDCFNKIFEIESGRVNKLLKS
jgi:ABC-type multidrug transport system fused ATPase/permease subunit